MITFSITVASTVSPEKICEGILDVNSWTSFEGYGPLPGIRKVTKESPLNTLIGTIFYVENTDGSKHREIISDFIHSRSITMKMDSFAPPLSNLATHFVERWEFSDSHPTCRITRKFELYPKSRLSTIPLWIISRLLKKAVVRHTYQITKQK
jgi:hypothetical protein